MIGLLQVVREMGKQLSTHAQQLAALVKFTVKRNTNHQRFDKGFMNKFPITVVTDLYTQDKIDFAIPVYQAVADGKIDDLSMGICWNTMYFARELQKEEEGLEFICFYNLTSKLFEAVSGFDNPYPLKQASWKDNFASRRAWCKVFAEGLQTGTLSVSDALFATLKDYKDNDE